MNGIIKKDILPVLILPLVLLPLMILYWSISRDSLDLAALFLETGYTIGLVMLVILIAEKQEMKNGGYAFLATLPIKTSEIVAARFILIFLMALLFTSVSAFFFSGLASDGAEARLALAVLVSGGSAGLILGGSAQVLSYRFGARKMIVPIVLLAAIGYMGPVFFDELLIEKGHVTVGHLMGLAKWATIGGVAAAGILIYILIAFMAVKVFRNHGVANA